MSKSNGSTPDIMPIQSGSEIHPKSLLEAIAYIEQNYANELGGCIIKSQFLTTKQRLEFVEVGFRSSFVSGIVMALLTPVAIGVVEHYIPAFGDSMPNTFDMICAIMLALSFPLGYGIFIAKAATCYIGGYTRAMVFNLIGGMISGAILKALIAFIAYHCLYFSIFSDRNVQYAVTRLYYFKISHNTAASIYDWIQGFKGVFLISSYFVLLSTAVFITIPILAMLFAWRRNRKLIAAGFVRVDDDKI